MLNLNVSCILFLLSSLSLSLSGSRLLTLFDTLLEHRLLYVEELEHFHSHDLFPQLKSGGIRPSSWFGATHLLRLVLYIMNGPKVVTISTSTARDGEGDGKGAASQQPTTPHQPPQPPLAFLDFDIALLGDVKEVRALLETCLRRIPSMIS